METGIARIKHICACPITEAILCKYKECFKNEGKKLNPVTEKVMRR